MKKILLIAVLFSLSLGATAQRYTKAMTGNGATITDTGSDTVTYGVLKCHDEVSIQAVVTQLTGTVTATTAILEGTIDGTNYDIIQDTLTCTSATVNSKIWVMLNSNFIAYRIVFIGTTEVTATIAGYVYASPSTGKHYVNNLLSSTALTSDTVVDAATEYVQVQLKDYYSAVAIQAVADKISGTAGGTITLQGSTDGAAFVTVSTDYASSTTTFNSAPTLTVLDQATTTKTFIVSNSPYQYYRLSYTGTGTMSVRLRGYVLTSKSR